MNCINYKIKKYHTIHTVIYLLHIQFINIKINAHTLLPESEKKRSKTAEPLLRLNHELRENIKKKMRSKVWKWRFGDQPVWAGWQLMMKFVIRKQFSR